jgi:putative spermidine/putrescine transport system substrate-binding protein
MIAALGLALIVLLVAAACGAAATATPEPEPTAMPEATATAAPTATPEPVDAGPRAMSEWTVDNPATRGEIEAALDKHRGGSLVFATWGGAYEAAQNLAYIAPFQEQFGIEIVTDTMQYAKVRAQVETNNLQWHVMDFGGQAAWQHSVDGWLEELDFSIIDNRDFLEAGRSPHFGGGGVTWSNVVAYSLESVDELWGGNHPTTMADVFDWDNFPGERSLASPEWSWKTSLRFALLSRYPEDLDTKEGRDKYPILSDEQVEEAYEILDEIGPQIKFWWSAGVDCPSGLISREIDFCTAWNGRIYDAQVKEGEPITICWSCGHMINTDSWGAPRGLAESAPDTFELAQLFMAWTSFPEINAELSKHISYGPMNLAAVPILDGPEFDEVRDHLPTSSSNVGYALIEDENHDGQIGDVMGERWVTWQQSLTN